MSLFARAMRWKFIIRPNSRLSFSQAYHPTVIGLMANCVLPARVGEFVRPFWHKARNDVPFAGCLASMAAERFFDLVILLGLLAATFWFMDVNSAVTIVYHDTELSASLLRQLAMSLLFFCLVLFIGILLLSSKRIGYFLKRLIMKLPSWTGNRAPRMKAFLDARVCSPLIQIIDRVTKGFSIMRCATDTLICIGLSIVAWLSWAAGYYVLALGSPSINLTFLEATASMVVICMFIALPSVPGYWGLWEAGGVFSLSLFGFNPEQTAGITLANHAVQMLPICLAGVVSVWITGFQFSRFRQSTIQSSSAELR